MHLFFPHSIHACRSHHTFQHLISGSLTLQSASLVSHVCAPHNTVCSIIPSFLYRLHLGLFHIISISISFLFHIICISWQYQILCLLAWEFLLFSTVLHFAYASSFRLLLSNWCAEALVAYRNSLLNRLSIVHGGKILIIIIIIILNVI